MKEFFKWLGVNEKIAKVVVWLLIIMTFLIMTNAMLESIGAPYYKLTIENLSKIKYHEAIEYLCSWLLAILNFLSITLLVFRIKDLKKIFKYSLLYLLLNVIMVALFDYTLSQIFILIFIILFCFFYSKKNWKYILYGIGALLFNAGLQFVCYLWKARFIDFSSISQVNRLITGIDFYIIIALVILAKEIYLRKRRGKNG